MPVYKVLRGIALISAAFLLGLLVKILLLGIVLIPSASMEGTLMVGDLVLVNKLRYGPVVSNVRAAIPFRHLLFGKEERNRKWERRKLKGYASVMRNDVLVFKRHYYEKQLVKRCIGLPGEEIEVKKNIVYIDGRETHSYAKITQLPIATNIYHTFPHSFQYRHWTIADFGPLLIPRKGQSVSLRPDNIDLYKEVIQSFENKKLTIDEDQIYIDGLKVTNYQFENNYYFVMGDNRAVSRDSRFFGFVPEKAILGTTSLVLFSFAGEEEGHEKDKRFFKRIK